MSSIRVIAGSLKGKGIPFLNRKFNDAEVTPQKVKKAIFSMLGEDLTGRSFLDLYSGSGQIGVEAYSRGARPVFFNEENGKRYHFIRTFLVDNEIREGTTLIHGDALRTLVTLQKQGLAFDIIFLDPPYEKRTGQAANYGDILARIEGAGTLDREGVIVIQHYQKNVLPERAGGFECVSRKIYGSTGLTFYRYVEENT